MIAAKLEKRYVYTPKATCRPNAGHQTNCDVVFRTWFEHNIWQAWWEYWRRHDNEYLPGKAASVGITLLDKVTRTPNLKPGFRSQAPVYKWYIVLTNIFLELVFCFLFFFWRMRLAAGSWRNRAPP